VAFNVQHVIDRESALWKTLWAWPKIELHRHLEGSTRLSTLVEVAREYDIPLPAYDVEHLRPYVQMTDKDEAHYAVFLGKFGVLRQFFRSMDIVRRLTYEAVEDAALDNVKYMELRFTPHALARQNNHSYEDVIAFVGEETARAARDFDIRVKLIVSVNRHESVEIAEQVLDAALAIENDDIVAVDMAGLETDHPVEPFRPFFERAKAAGLYTTIHAGEWAGPESVAEALEDVQPDRIGHGVRAVEDSSVIRAVRERGITFEVCPTSNLQSGVAARMDLHPLIDLIGLGVPTTLNTDDPSLCNITLTDELALAYAGLGLSMDMIKENIIHAARVAFLPDDERAAMVAWFEDALRNSAASPE
jgi:adenosine deaminase